MGAKQMALPFKMKSISYILISSNDVSLKGINNKAGYMDYGVENWEVSAHNTSFTILIVYGPL